MIMEQRPPALQHFLDRLHDALASENTIETAVPTIAKIFNSLKTPMRASGSGKRLPVCAYLDQALKPARMASASLAHVADAFQQLEPNLVWRTRPGGPTASANFTEGHANVMIVGPGAFEERDDVWIGASLMAPQVRYPDHNHKPEEVYLVLSPGEFRQDHAPWFEPGIGGTLFNVPNITHAMRSGDAPFFAIWCLWVDKEQAG